MKKQQHNKLIPQLRFFEFKNDGEWEEKRLNEVLRSESSQIALNKIELKPQGYPLYGADGFIGCVDSFDQNEDYIGIVKDGSGVGRLFLNKGKTSILGTLAYLKTIEKNKFILDWFYYLLNSKDFSSHIKGSGIPHIYFSDYGKEKVGIPSPKEQQKIAACLSSLDEVIELESEKLTALQTHKRGLLQKLFPAEGRKAPEFRFREFRKDGEWEEKKLGEVADYSSKRIPLSELELDSYISTENILPDYRGITKSSKLPNNGSFTKYEIGDILVSNIRPYLKKIWMANKEGGASNDILVFKGKLGINKIFLSFILKNDRFIKAMMQGARGVKMPRGDKFLIITYPIFLPTLKEQEKIASCLSSIDELIESQSKKIEQLKNHKKGLMQQLFP